MAAFQYTALNKQGHREKGVLEGDTLRHVRKLLRDMNMLPLSIEAVAKHENELKNHPSFIRGISTWELALVTRQLSSLIRAKLPLDEAINAVSKECEKQRLKNILMAVRASILEGKSFAEGLAEYPYIFDEQYCAMVAAGENSGCLDLILNRLADHIEQLAYIRQKVLLAIIYPCILAVIVIAVISGLLIYVVPKIIEQFANTEQQLPLLTQGLIKFSDVLSNYGLWIFLICLMSGFFLKYFLRDPGIKRKFHHVLLNTPILGKYIKINNSSRFCRTLSILTVSSIPLVEALDIAKGVVKNIVLQDVVEKTILRVKEGASFSAALRENGYFPEIMLHMIANGEKSGELDEMLDRVADYQDNDFDRVVTLALGLIEPFLILSMGLIILLIVLAILLPVFELNNLVQI